MEVISGIISGILILAVLVTFPLGLRARRRALKEIAELGSQLEEKTKSLVEAVESLVEEAKVARPSSGETRSGEYRTVDIKVRGVPWKVTVPVKGAEAQLSMLQVLLKDSFVSPTRELHFIGREEFFRIVRTETFYKDVEKTMSKSGAWHLLTSPRYLPIEKEHVYVK